MDECWTSYAESGKCAAHIQNKLPQSVIIGSRLIQKLSDSLFGSGPATACAIPIVLLALLIVVSGCASRQGQATHHNERELIRAVHSQTDIKLDGILDEAVWRVAPAYELQIASEYPSQKAFESGRVRVCWNQNYLYVAVEFEDSDMVAESTEDQVHHYRYGDVAELFLKPTIADCYWELYATPRGNRIAFFYPSRGRLGLPSNVDGRSGLRVAARVDGTIGDWTDQDCGWSAEFAVPVAELVNRAGVDWDAGSTWTILVGRYNYGRYNQRCELTTDPGLPKADFHDLARFASLFLEAPSAATNESSR